MKRLGKIRIRSGDRIVGTIEQHADGQYEYQVRRTRGFAGSYADALTLVRKLSAILDKRSAAA